MGVEWFKQGALKKGFRGGGGSFRRGGDSFLRVIVELSGEIEWVDGRERLVGHG